MLVASFKQVKFFGNPETPTSNFKLRNLVSAMKWKNLSFNMTGCVSAVTQISSNDKIRFTVFDEANIIRNFFHLCT